MSHLTGSWVFCFCKGSLWPRLSLKSFLSLPPFPSPPPSTEVIGMLPHLALKFVVLSFEIGSHNPDEPQTCCVWDDPDPPASSCWDYRHGLCHHDAKRSPTYTVSLATSPFYFGSIVSSWVFLVEEHNVPKPIPGPPLAGQPVPLPSQCPCHPPGLCYLTSVSAPLQHYASRNGHYAVCQFLLESGAKCDAQTHGGATALHRASYCGHTEIARLLLSHGSNPRLVDDDGMTSLHKVCPCLCHTFLSLILFMY